jgi:hypothetical protein
VLVNLLATLTKYLRKNLREEGFLLAHSFKGFNPRSLGSIASWPVCGEAEHHGRKHVVEQSDLPYGGQQGGGEGSRDKVYPQ